MTLAQIKALFKTGAIPTQADFENLIDKIPDSDKLWGSLTINTVISEPGQYNVVAFAYDSTALFTAFELTLTKNTNEHFIIGLLKQTEYIIVKGQFKPKITWFSIADRVGSNMPYYSGSKTFGDIVSFARTKLTSYTSEPNLEV
jgi:hypothetical protein